MENIGDPIIDICLNLSVDDIKSLLLINKNINEKLHYYCEFIFRCIKWINIISADKSEKLQFTF